jgi:hypothetical protein
MGVSAAELQIYLNDGCSLKQLLKSKGLELVESDLPIDGNFVSISKDRVLLWIPFAHPLDLLELQAEITITLRAYFEEDPTTSIQDLLRNLDPKKVAEASGLTLLEVIDFRDNPALRPTRQQIDKLAAGLGMEVDVLLDLVERQFGPQVDQKKMKGKK